MSSNWKAALGLLTVVLVVGLVVAMAPGRPAAVAAEGAAGAGPRYTVVATDGTHLVVTDNTANKVHFYAIEQGGKPGDALKFRGSINLNDVGKPTIQPTKE